MKKLVFFISLFFLTVILTGCFTPKKSGNYANFVRRDEGKVIGQETNKKNVSLRIYGVYPSEISTEGKEQITVYGEGFERGTSVFLQNPEMKIEAFVFNPGYLLAWMPPWPAGHYILGVINPDSTESRWSGVFTYIEKKD